MKVFISADIEGVTGVTAWNEATPGTYEYAAACKQMTKEVLAACEACNEMGVEKIYVKDSHDIARNIDITALPENVILIKGWTNHPTTMVAGLDESFDAMMYIGYHAAAGCNGNPLAHTMNTANNYVKINGKIASEFDMHTYIAAHYNVPIIFLSGDKELCEKSKELCPNLETVAVKEGIGGATFNLNPEYACKLIKEGVKKGLAKKDSCRIPSPEKFELEINFREHTRALQASFYPGVEQLDEKTVKFIGSDIIEMMIARMFIL